MLYNATGQQLMIELFFIMAHTDTYTCLSLLSSACVFVLSVCVCFYTCECVGTHACVRARMCLCVCLYTCVNDRTSACISGTERFCTPQCCRVDLGSSDLNTCSGEQLHANSMALWTRIPQPDTQSFALSTETFGLRTCIEWFVTAIFKVRVL